MSAPVGSSGGTVPRSWLYVPGHRADRVAKALVAGADAVVIDLEDAVPADQKDAARHVAVDVLGRRDSQGPAVWVRVNSPATQVGGRDVDALAGAPADGLRLPRSDEPQLVRDVADRTGLPLQVLIETATGLARALELGRAHPLVAGLGLGEADLAADLLVDHDEGLTWARGAVVVASRAAGLPSPVQSVWTDVADLDGLRRSSVTGRACGFFGRSVVHPKQIAVVHAVYTPTQAEVAAARDVVRTAQSAAARGEVAVLDRHGRLIDPAVVKQAHVVLDRARPNHFETIDPGDPA